MHARSVHPNTPAQALHVDFAHDDHGWPMVGFIIMVDEFRQNNGATRFVPGSHRRSPSANDRAPDEHAIREQEVLACGPAGSLIIYNGSIWHGHSANLTSEPRRSIQGAYIRRDAEGWFQQNSRPLQGTIDRISPMAKYLLAL
jgi:ectoine hydroxylase-related dioxygenase (phytanoyl-CoA dioxygenase family)